VIWGNCRTRSTTTTGEAWVARERQGGSGSRHAAHAASGPARVLGGLLKNREAAGGARRASRGEKYKSGERDVNHTAPGRISSHLPPKRHRRVILYGLGRVSIWRGFEAALGVRRAGLRCGRAVAGRLWSA
jgi:hypothetical protein